jgi:hypothetical protein
MKPLSKEELLSLLKQHLKIEINTITNPFGCEYWEDKIKVRLLFDGELIDKDECDAP